VGIHTHSPLCEKTQTTQPRTSHLSREADLAEDYRDVSVLGHSQIVGIGVFNKSLREDISTNLHK